MSPIDGKTQFLEEVYPAELEEINARRRRALGEDAELPEGRRPSTRQGLVGLALSGGGIRSATFGLGVIQALAKRRALRHFDYLSTVSGGGFIGSCLSMVLNSPDTAPDGDRFPLEHHPGGEESAALQHLRSSGNYLTPGGILDKFRLAALVVRGILLNLILFLPIIMIAVVVTEIGHELGASAGPIYRRSPIWALAVFLALVVTFPVVTRVIRPAWRGRNAYERLFAFWLFLTLLLLAMVPVLLVIDQAVDFTWEDFREQMSYEMGTALGAKDYLHWLVPLVVILALMLASTVSSQVSKWTGRIVQYALGIVGPLVLFAIYFVLCVLQIDSPVLKPETVGVVPLPAFEEETPETLGEEADCDWIRQRVRPLIESHESLRALADGADCEELEPGRVWRLDEYADPEPLPDDEEAPAEAGAVVAEERPLPAEDAVETEGADPAAVAERPAARPKLDLCAPGESRPALRVSYDPDEAQLRVQHDVAAELDHHCFTPGLASELIQRGLELDPSSPAEVEVRGSGSWSITSGENTYRIDRSRHHLELRTPRPDLWDGTTDWIFFGMGLLLLAFNVLVVNVNLTSSHEFYRDRLSHAYLFRTRKHLFGLLADVRHDLDQGKVPDDLAAKLAENGIELEPTAVVRPVVPGRIWRSLGRHGSYTIAQEGDRVEVFEGLTPVDDQRLSELCGEQTTAPYHLINCTLNLQPSARHADFFVFSKRFVGGPNLAFADTREVERRDPHLDLGTAMAISGAAASPNMGGTDVKGLTFIMTLLNIRLGYWLPNPRRLGEPSRHDRLVWKLGVGPWHLIKEAMGWVDDRGPFVNLSDGGHLENLGVYELLRRRCRLIVAVDAEEDADYGFGALVRLVRFARTDMGIQIALDLERLQQSDGAFRGSHWALGRIRYPGRTHGEEEIGHLVYLKASLTGDEDGDLLDYHQRNPSFPHESTADQSFSEAQFEAYRTLGRHIGGRTLAELRRRSPGLAALLGID